MLVYAHIAQSVEHILGKNEVIGSSPIVGSCRFQRQQVGSLGLGHRSREICTEVVVNHHRGSTLFGNHGEVIMTVRPP